MGGRVIAILRSGKTKKREGNREKDPTEKKEGKNDMSDVAEGLTGSVGEDFKCQGVST